MSLSWYMVHDASGNAVSMGTVVANPLPNGLSATALTTEEAEAIMAGESRWDATTLAVVPVTPPVPESVHRWNIRRGLVLRYQLVPADVEAFIIANVQEPIAQACALIDWRDAERVRRDHWMVEPFCAWVAATKDVSVDADEFFVYADSLQP